MANKSRRDRASAGTMEQTFIVTVTRLAPQTKEIEVQAASAQEAYAKAMEIAPGLDFSGLDKDSEYEVEAVEPVTKT